MRISFENRCVYHFHMSWGRRLYLLPFCTRNSISQSCRPQKGWSNRLKRLPAHHKNPFLDIPCLIVQLSPSVVEQTSSPAQSLLALTESCRVLNKHYPNFHIFNFHTFNFHTISIKNWTRLLLYLIVELANMIFCIPSSAMVKYELCYQL